MYVTVTPEVLTDPTVQQLALNFLMNGGTTSRDGRDTGYLLDVLGEQELSKDYIEVLIAKGARISGSCHFYAEVAHTFTDNKIPRGWPGGDIYNDEGFVITSRTWEEQCIVFKGLNTSLIMFVDKVNGANGNPEGLSPEDFLRYRTEFPDYLVATDYAAWAEVNSPISIIG